MKQIETSIALPVRQIVNPVQLVGGGVIALTGAALALTHMLPLF